jgi:uncharacterized protein YvpB
VNVAGAYLTGMSVMPSSGGSCDGGGTMVTASGTVPAVTVSGGSSSGGSGGPAPWVPVYQQQRNLSCEYAALYIATAAFGNGISEYAFDSLVGLSENPHWGYRGTITGQWGNTTDYGVYAAALAPALAQFGFVGDVFYSDGAAAPLMRYLDQQIPTVVWLSLYGDPGYYEYTSDGVRYKLVPYMHVMVAYAYDDNRVYLSDPGSGQYVSYGWGDFLAMWGVLDGMGLAVYPA